MSTGHISLLDVQAPWGYSEIAASNFERFYDARLTLGHFARSAAVERRLMNYPLRKNRVWLSNVAT
jgi:hypothetical protein